MPEFRNLVALMAVMALLAGCGGCSVFQTRRVSPELVESALRARSERLSHNPQIGKETTGVAARVQRLYEIRQFSPIWFLERSTEAFDLTEQVKPFLSYLKEADREGLEPSEYHIQAIEKQLAITEKEKGPRLAAAMAELELLLTDAYLSYGTHLFLGRINPNLLMTEDYGIRRGRVNLTSLLSDAVEKNRVVESLQDLAPEAEGYGKLKTELSRYRAIASKGGWEPVSDGPDLKVGARGPRVLRLRTRLRLTGELTESSQSPVYDRLVADAVKRFQAGHGLRESGRVDSKTLNELNVPVIARIQSILVNLERWRWLPRSLGDRYLFVDIANFKLYLYENGHPTLTMRIAVGKDNKETPVFKDSMTYLVVNPAWNIPRSISTEEILPKLKKNPDYLDKQNMELFRLGEEKVAIDPHSVDWNLLTENNFPYGLKQKPGKGNPLGSIKFMMPNQFSVYLHGTSNPSVFEKEVRTVSHGCIRIQDPMALASILLKGTAWDEAKLKESIARGEEQIISLARPIPVQVFYWTAWVDEKSRLNFRRDIYGWDQPVLSALQAESRAPSAFSR